MFRSLYNPLISIVQEVLNTLICLAIFCINIFHTFCLHVFHSGTLCWQDISYYALKEMSPLILQHSSERREYTFPEWLIPHYKLPWVSSGHFKAGRKRCGKERSFSSHPASVPWASPWGQAASCDAPAVMGQVLGWKNSSKHSSGFFIAAEKHVWSSWGSPN